jgi:hypothetical protein
MSKLEHSVVNSAEIACPAGLVFLGAKGEGVNVDASVGRACGVGKAEPSK